MLTTARRTPRRGAVTVWVVACLSVLLGVAAIGMDGGRMLDERRRVQSGADAAATAAGADLYENYTTNKGADPNGTARAAALRLAATNGYANDGTNSVVTVNIPPQSGQFVGQADYVEVLIESRADAGFSRIFARDKLSVRGRAVARGRPKSVAVVVLEPSAPDAFVQSGNGTVRVYGSVHVNSASSLALAQDGNGPMIADSFEIVGGYREGYAGITGSIRTNADPAPDPLRALPPPNPADYPLRSSSKYDISTDGAVALRPGVYRGGIQISSKATVSMEPGVYYIDGGGFQISGDATIRGDGVMLYNAGGSRAGKIQFSGNGPTRWTAPTSGPYRGITVFQDRAVDLEIQISGLGAVDFGGIVYARAALFTISGNGDVTSRGFVTRVLKAASGEGDVTVDPGPDRPRIPDVRLVD